MITLKSRDFSFIGEKHVGQLYHLFEELHIKPNLTQNGAISFTCVLDDWPDKIDKLAAAAAEFLDVQVMKDLSLLTVRHFTTEIFEKLLAGRKPLLQQQTRETVQVLLA
jgi:aspartate kinase